MNIKDKRNKLMEAQKNHAFLGAFYAKKQNEVITGSSGFRNRAKKLENQVDTRFSLLRDANCLLPLLLRSWWKWEK